MLPISFMEVFSLSPSGTKEEHLITSVCPSVTRWKAHGRGCKVLYDGYQQLLVALYVALNERQEPETKDLFSALAEEEFLATLLLLRVIFDAITPLNLALQKSQESLCLSNVMFIQYWQNARCIEKVDNQRPLV